ncbi:MAG: flagellar protein FlgN [Nitrosomonas sp. PRO4]|nr:flagellar protein FlgN [Nitrosomonas sp. PRO4]
MALFQLDFTSLLEAERSALEKFIEVLKREEAALIHGKIEQIDSFISTKSYCIEELMQIDNKRNHFILNQGITLESSCINKWLQEKYSDRFEVQILWSELLALANIAKIINYSNGLMISNRLKYIERTYAALYCAAGKISLYGSKGQAYI